MSEYPNQTQADETIEYIVIEAGVSTIDTINCVMGLGSDMIRGVSDSLLQLLPEWTFRCVRGNRQPIGDGWQQWGGGLGCALRLEPGFGWLQLAIDEDQQGDTERNHITEHVAYIVFDSPINAAPLAQVNLEPTAPAVSVLLQSFPNPGNPGTWIPFRLSKAGDVTIRVYNATGRLVRTLNLGYTPPGVYVSRSRAAYWDVRNAYGDKVEAASISTRCKPPHSGQLRKQSYSSREDRIFETVRIENRCLTILHHCRGFPPGAITTSFAGL